MAVKRKLIRSGRGAGADDQALVLSPWSRINTLQGTMMPLFSRAILFLSLAVTIQVCCSCSQKTCPAGETLVGTAFGAQCQKAVSTVTPVKSGIAGVSLVKRAIQDECGLNQTVNIYNNNNFIVTVTASSTPVSPDWTSAELTVEVPANTGTEAPKIIGKEKYPSRIFADFCDTYNYNLVKIEKK